MSQIPNDPELTGIESALGGLIPVSSRLDRDRLMFQAGALSRSRSRRDRWAWPSIAALLSLVVLCESVFLARRPAPRIVERVVVVHEPANALPGSPLRDRADPSPAPLVILNQDPESLGNAPGSLALAAGSTDWDYRRLQEMVLRFGFEGFPEPARRSSLGGGPPDIHEPPSSTAGALRRLELEKLFRPGDHS